MVRRKIGLIGFVHRFVVAIEFSQIDPTRKDMRQIEAKFGQNDNEVVHDTPRLRLNAFWQRLRIVLGIGRHLSCELDPAVALDGMAKGRNLVRRRIETVKYRPPH